jgi:annexin A6
MTKDIQGDVSGDYGKLLLLLLKDPSERTYESPDGGPSEPEEPHVIEMVEEPKIEETPTLTDYQSFNPNDDCERLRKAVKGLGTDEKTIIQILGKRTNKQRQQLKQTYTQMLGRDLLKDMKDDLSGDFCDVVEALLMSKDEYDARSFNKAIRGLGTDESAIVELLTTRSADEINSIKAKYQSCNNFLYVLCSIYLF